MGFDRVRRHGEVARDLLIGAPGGDEGEDFIFARRDAERGEGLFVLLEGGGLGARGELRPRPGAERGEGEGDEHRVEFAGEDLRHILVLDPLQERRREGEREAVEEDGAVHGRELTAGGGDEKRPCVGFSQRRRRRE